VIAAYTSLNKEDNVFDLNKNNIVFTSIGLE